MNTAERIAKLEEAQELLREVKALVRDAVRGTDRQHYAEAYTLPTISMLEGDSHGYLGGNPGHIEGLINSLSDSDED